jgi:intracellular sulfur oxidation DsrE/DsrF family protein
MTGTSQACSSSAHGTGIGLPGVGTVDSGVAEVVRLQEAGWSYVKSGS